MPCSITLQRKLNRIFSNFKNNSFKETSSYGHCRALSVHFLSRGYKNILLSRLRAAESVLRASERHCRVCFEKCLQTGERIFFNRIKHTRKIVLALRRSYFAFLGAFGARGYNYTPKPLKRC